MGSSNRELKDLTNRLVDRATAYGIEVSSERSKIMTNSTNNTFEDFSMNCQKLEEVTSFKYLGANGTRMTFAQQKWASELSQRWQQWPD